MEQSTQALHQQAFENWKPAETCTLLFVVRKGQVLLMRKHRGLGAGFLVGPGGKVDPGETPIEAALRETREELLIEVKDPEQLGELQFQFTDGFALRVWVFKATTFEGTPSQTEEGTPEWFAVDNMPYEHMWEDDSLWMPLLFDDKPFVGRFVFEKKRMLTSEIEQL